MGNCLKSPTADDISLLHESQSDRASFGDGTDPDLEPPPPYQVSSCSVSTSRCFNPKGPGGERRGAEHARHMSNIIVCEVNVS